MLTGRISNRLRIGSNSGNSVKFNTQQGECEGVTKCRCGSE